MASAITKPQPAEAVVKVSAGCGFQATKSGKPEDASQSRATPSCGNTKKEY
jgi:hypothetical protein